MRLAWPHASSVRPLLPVFVAHPSLVQFAVSQAAVGLCAWVRAMEHYARVMKVRNHCLCAAVAFSRSVSLESCNPA